MCLLMKVLLSQSIMKPAPILDRENSNQAANLPQKQTINNPEIKPYQWAERWLKGDEYSHILEHVDQYCDKFHLEKYQYKTHPQSIYKNPINGLIYFVKGKGVGSDFGFPRVNAKKKYRWKKMNFTTNLPKKQPYVTYVVASAMKANIMDNEAELPDYRMHAVIPYQGNEKKMYHTNYILCHVREVQSKRHEDEQNDLKSCFIDECPDFYKLFSFLHNFEINTTQK